MNRSLPILTAALLAASSAVALAEQTTPAKPQPQHPTMSKHRVERIQAALNNHGEQIAVDGILGPKTRQALRDFQHKNGLKTTGSADQATVQKLNPPNWNG